jgi:hypothetical protein
MDIRQYNSEMGMQYWYQAPALVLSVGTAPAAGNNWLGIPGDPASTQFTIENDDFVGIDLVAQCNGPFLVEVNVAYINLTDSPTHWEGIFGISASYPNRLLIPFTAQLSQIVSFKCYDISYVANNLVYISIAGVQKKQVG